MKKIENLEKLMELEKLYKEGKITGAEGKAEDERIHAEMTDAEKWAEVHYELTRKYGNDDFVLYDAFRNWICPETVIAYLYELGIDRIALADESTELMKYLEAFVKNGWVLETVIKVQVNGRKERTFDWDFKRAAILSRQN